MIIIEGPASDISTVFAYYTQETYDALPDPGVGPYGALQKPKCDFWSAMGDSYKLGHERQFIAEIEALNPGKYGSYRISWSDCN